MDLLFVGIASKNDGRLEYLMIVRCTEMNSYNLQPKQ